MYKMDATRIKRSIRTVEKQFYERMEKLRKEMETIREELRDQCSHAWEDGKSALSWYGEYKDEYGCYSCGRVVIVSDDPQKLPGADNEAASADLGPAPLGDVVVGVPGVSVEPVATDPEVSGHGVQVVDAEGSAD